jgi:uncharacterized membrane protein YoaK (UPF0700 family)
MIFDAPRPDRSLSFALAFVGGYSDAISFVLAKTFTGHMTGNSVLGAIAVAGRDWRGALARLLAVVCFLAGIILSGLIARALANWPSWPVLSTAVGIEVLLIVVAYFVLASHAVARLESFVVCMSLALGLQNGAFRRTGGISVHTTYLTGMITGLIATQAETYLSSTAPDAKTTADPKFGLLYGICAAFVLGAVTGAKLVFKFGAFAVLGAALVLFAIIVRNSLAVALI